MKHYMIKTKSPVIFDGKDCGNLINFYRYVASSEKDAIDQWLQQERNRVEFIDYVRSYNG